MGLFDVFKKLRDDTGRAVADARDAALEEAARELDSKRSDSAPAAWNRALAEGSRRLRAKKGK